MKAPAFWHQPPGWASSVLSPLGWLYGKGASVWRGLSKSERFPVPVISIGNITCGGAGKTPTAIALGQLLKAQGYSVHFVTRGYGGSLKGPLQVNPCLHRAQDVGDEPLLLAHSVPTWVAKIKKAGIEEAIRQGAQIIILDDGHQTTGIHKDLSLVVVDSLQGFGNGHVMPAGPLREPLTEGLRRADALVEIGKSPLKSALPVFKAHIHPSPLPFKDKPCVAFCGLGFPQKFYNTLTQQGATVLKTYSFPDHYPYKEQDLVTLEKNAKVECAVLVTTRKDWIRLPAEWQNKVYVLDITLRFEAPDALYKWVLKRLFS